jgi:hypothetical protein
VKILCPSKGRAGKVLLTNLLRPDMFTLVVPAKELAEYTQAYPENNVIAPPEKVKGITATRHWMLDTFVNDDDVMMLDDDIHQVRKNYCKAGEPFRIKDPELILEFLESTAHMARQLKSGIFGYSSIRNPLEFECHKVFKCFGMLNGACMGFLKGFNLRYHPDIVTADDYYITLLHTYHNRYFLVDQRISFHTKDTLGANGGVSDVRNTENMKSDTLLLRECFGEVVKAKAPTTTHKTVAVGERVIKSPF